MQTAAPAGPLAGIGKHGDLALIAGVVLIVVMMVLPMPPFLLDLLIACNISLALLVLMLCMNVQQPLQFSVFPSLLLILTLFRLALNVSSTRLILLHGYAGSIIQAFGGFVVGGNYVVGFVVFLILVVIQFIVITKGAERVAEVAARFTLDAMPGKQMSIDADLNAGLISENDARQRRQEIEREADFYGAMDGASKFVKGDAIAGMVITAINIIGGLAVGVGQRGLPVDQAVQRYTLLTVGDGLVTQIPALLVSTATGIIVTRAAAEANMGQDLGRQLFAQPRVLYMGAGVLALFGVVPGLPTAPFFVLGALVGGLGYMVGQEARLYVEQARATTERQEIEDSKKPESVMSLLQVDLIELEIGYSLIPLVDHEQGGDLLDRITMIRRQIALELGVVVPSIRIRDNMQLKPNAYVVKVKGIEVGRGELMVHHYLAMDSGAAPKQSAEKLEGIATREPAFGLPALWIPEERRADAELLGYTVVDPPAVLATHLTEIIRAHAGDLLGRQEVKALLDGLREEFGAVVEELVPGLLSLGEIQRVLQNLLREGVPIRNLVTILEALADAARTTKDPDGLTNAVREALAPQISHMYTGEEGFVPVVTLDPNLEEEIAGALERTERGTTLAWRPQRVQRFFERLTRALESAAAAGYQAVLLCSPELRLPLKRLTQRPLPRLVVLSYGEITPATQVQSVSVVSLADAG